MRVAAERAAAVRGGGAGGGGVGGGGLGGGGDGDGGSDGGGAGGDGGGGQAFPGMGSHTPQVCLQLLLVNADPPCHSPSEGFGKRQSPQVFRQWFSTLIVPQFSFLTCLSHEACFQMSAHTSSGMLSTGCFLPQLPLPSCFKHDDFCQMSLQGSDGKPGTSKPHGGGRAGGSGGGNDGEGGGGVGGGIGGGEGEADGGGIGGGGVGGGIGGGERIGGPLGLVARNSGSHCGEQATPQTTGASVFELIAEGWVRTAATPRRARVRKLTALCHT